MSEEKKPVRPRQVTMAAVMAVVGSVVLVLSLVDTLGRLRTPETRQAIDDFLAEPPGSSLTLETAQVVELMRMLAYASGALAAMVLVFAVYVLQRHRAARVGLTVAAALLLVTVPVAGLLPVFIAVAAMLVWSQPARDWYAGRVPAVAAAGRSGVFSSQPDDAERPGSHVWRPDQQPPPPAPPSAWTLPEGRPDQGATGHQGAAGHQGGEQPGQYPGQFGQPGQAGPPAPQPWGTFDPAYGYSAYAAPQRDPDKRPVTVAIAAVLTWIGSGAVIALMVIAAGGLVTDRDYFVEEFDAVAQDAQMAVSADQILATVWATIGVLLFWSLVSAVLAFFAFKRSNGARIALAVSASVAALLSLLLILSIVSAIPLILAGVTVVLLFTGGANEWYARRGPMAPGYAPHGYPPQQPYQPPESQEKQKPW